MLSLEQKSLVIGSLLGDGHLQLNTKNRYRNARLIIKRSLVDKNYLLWQSEIIKDFCSDNSIKEYTSFDIRAYKSYNSISLTTKVDPLFTEYHKLWYNGIKVIPRDLVLNKLVILIWFLDDGCISINKNKLELKFATHSFLKEDVYFLKSLLEDRYDRKYSIYDVGNNQNIIYAYGDAVLSFIEDIKDIYPFHIMSRKATWVGYQPKIRSSVLKTNKIISYLSGRNSFSLNELGKNCGFIFNRDGKLEVTISNLKKYIKTYIDKMFIIEDNANFSIKKHYKITDLGKDFFNKEAFNGIY